MPNPRTLNLGTLPARLPLFPLAGVLLLPRGGLPLNVFEPRYLALVDDALAGDRLIGMIQPSQGDEVLRPDGQVWKLIWSKTYDPAADGSVLTMAYGEQ